VIDAERQQAEAALAGTIAERYVAELNLGYTELRAPVDEPSAIEARRRSAQIMSIAPAKGLWVDANFKERQLAAMRPGQAASITADVLPGQTFTRHVASIAPATGAQFSILPVENATGNFTKIFSACSSASRSTARPRCSDACAPACP
jgi:membrane fusion protein, multidrug efflux system